MNSLIEKEMKYGIRNSKTLVCVLTDQEDTSIETHEEL